MACPIETQRITPLASHLQGIEQERDWTRARDSVQLLLTRWVSIKIKPGGISSAWAADDFQKLAVVAYYIRNH
jgi:hypothetical protein